MKIETKTLVAYSADLKAPAQVEDDEEYTRLVLSELFYTAARLVRDTDRKLNELNRLTLELETCGWDQKFVLKLEKVSDEST